MAVRCTTLRKMMQTAMMSQQQQPARRQGRRASSKIPLCWLDLRGSGLSVLERLCLEECILQKEAHGGLNSTATATNSPPPRHWVIAGHHEAVRHRYLKERDVVAWNINENESSLSSWDVDATSRNEQAAIVLGIGGKPEQLLELERVRRDRVLTLKRFSGGGTVVLDYDSIWTTVIGRHRELVPESSFPRPIMEWSSDAIFGPTFERLEARQQSKQRSSSSSDNDGGGSRFRERTTMVMDTKSCAVENTGRTIKVKTIQDVVPSSSSSSSSFPKFQLRENDYVLGERKMGGNAQSIGKTGFLHHTSFLWDYQDENMEYLSLPSKRPEYRGDRTHNDFLVKLKDVYPDLKKADFFAALAETCEEQFAVERVTLRDAMAIVKEQGGMKAWLEKGSRTKILRDV